MSMVKKPLNLSIYVLKDPSSFEIRYVGKTTNINKRMVHHLLPSQLKSNTHKNNWIKSLLKKNVSPIIEVVCTCKFKNGNRLEKHFITYFKNKGNRLTNGTSGGDGWPKGYPMPNTNGRMNGAKSLMKPVVAINIKTNRERIFKSVIDCAKAIGSIASIVSCVLKQRKNFRTVKGYRVFYLNGSRLLRESNIYKSIPVIGINLKTFKLKYFEAKIHTETKDKFDSHCVTQVCKGIRKTHKGYWWFYA